MASFNEMPFRIQLLVVLGAVLGLSIGAYFLVYKTQADQNRLDRQQLEAKRQENNNLRQYEPKLQEINRQLASLRQQLEIQRRIVPDEKEAPQFIRLMQTTAAGAGVEIRRYTARPTVNKEYFTEAPFEMELDGPYYSVLSFFERVRTIERIVNVSTLKMASVAKPTDAGAKKTYKYAPGESVVATCVATTFYSHDLSAAPNAAAPDATGAKKP
jgi:type IV pilus assembly protein PilO